jgi:hypothetical protein
MLDELKDLIKVFRDNLSRSGKVERAGDMYCPMCGDVRKMNFLPVYSLAERRGINLVGDIAEQITPALFYYQCVQCATSYTGIVYNGQSGPALAVFPSCYGGLRTPHTPEGVAYYLDQASRSESTGANSAAIAMFRGALEQILFEQGYQTGMLSSKINKLEEDIKQSSAPKWAMEMDTEFLQVIKDLGNGSIHPNDGDVKKQAILDNDLISKVKFTFQMLLFTIYELPHKKTSLLTDLRTKAKILKK